VKHIRAGGPVGFQPFDGIRYAPSIGCRQRFAAGDDLEIGIERIARVGGHAELGHGLLKRDHLLAGHVAEPLADEGLVLDADAGKAGPDQFGHRPLHMEDAAEAGVHVAGDGDGHGVADQLGHPDELGQADGPVVRHRQRGRAGNAACCVCIFISCRFDKLRPIWCRSADANQNSIFSSV